MITIDIFEEVSYTILKITTTHLTHPHTSRIGWLGYCIMHIQLQFDKSNFLRF